MRLYRRRQLPRQLDPDLDLLIGTRSLINSLDYGLMAEAAVHGVPVHDGQTEVRRSPRVRRSQEKGGHGEP